jgi:hypothetical protein
MTNGKTNHPDHPNINTKIELVDQWLADLVREVRENRRLLDEHIKKGIEKDKRIEQLELKVNNLEIRLTDLTENGRNKSPTEVNYDNLYRTDKENVNAERITISKVVREIRNEEKRENNITVSGITESTEIGHDERQIDRILTELSLDRSAVKKQTRLKKKNMNNGNGNNEKPPLIIVEFKTNGDQTKALKNSKNLKRKDEFNGIYINADKTAVERMEEKVLREERNRRNQSLPNTLSETDGRRYEERDGKKMYWGIRWGRLQWVEHKE